MLIIDKLKATWLYAIVITAGSAGAITYGVLDAVVVTPTKEEVIRQAAIVSELRGQIESLRKTLNRAKDQYDIPDAVIADFSRPNETSTKAIDFENFDVIEPDKLTAPVTTVIRAYSKSISHNFA